MEKDMKRPSWDQYFMEMAELTAKRSTCIRRNVGAVIVKDKHAIATGYNGAPRGRKNCCDLGFCLRDKLNIPRGERYEMCRSIHAEANAIISASREEMIGSTLYMASVDPKTGELISGTSSCAMCKRQVINAGISTVIVRDSHTDYRIISVSDWIADDDSLSGKFGY